MYAEIAINAPVANTFDYHVPPELEGKLQPGHLVQVPFGRALQHGIVLRVFDDAPGRATKPIAARLDPRPALTEAQIDLARWMSETYLSPLGPCLWLMLPPGITGGRDILVTLVKEDGKTASALEAELVALLKRRGPLRGAQLNQALPGQPWRASVDALVKAGVLEKESILTPPRVKPRTIQTATLAITPDEIDNALRAMAKPSPRADLLETVMQFDGSVLQTRANKAVAARLVKEGLVRVAEDNTLSLAVPRAEAEARLDEIRRLEKPRRILRLLAEEGGAMDVNELYTRAGVTLADLKRLQNEGLLILGEKSIWRDSLADREFVPAAPPPLTAEQDAAWREIRAAIESRAWTPAQAKRERAERASAAGWCFLLHGVTGSGKTEIYLRAIEHTLELGRSAILLVPEIALTAQTVRRVASRFAGQVAVVHSGLSIGERYDTWRRARDGLIRVVVGARSALFTPLKDLGLVVLDEEHDHSYKQAESGVGFPGPYYHARHVAEEMMRRRNGVLILGSATPDLETSFRARRGDIRRLHMPNRIMGHRARIEEQAAREGVTSRYASGSGDAVMIDLPPVHVVDMRRELKSGNTSIFSRQLQAALNRTLERGEQAILFINRRGQATYVFCRDCGYVAACPRCDSPLTHHRQGQALRCHRCGFEQPEPSVCPQCRSARIKFFGAGTQHIEQALHEMFPGAHTVRWDADTASSPEAHENILQRFIDRKADVMVGTQMVAKGLDLPLVTLVGVVSADLGLALPDFRAGERTFQTLTQVAGRAGRGLLGGQVILQTYQPDHYVIQAAAGHDYEKFFEREISYRRELGYPPFRRFVRIIFRLPNEARTREEAERAKQLLQRQIKAKRLTGTEIIGPAPCFFTKVNRFYRWHLLLRGPDPTVALKDIDLPKGWFVDVDPMDVL